MLLFLKKGILYRFHFFIDGKKVKDLKKDVKKTIIEEEDSADHAPISPYVPSPKDTAATTSSASNSETITERDAEESARILAEFKVSK